MNKLLNTLIALLFSVSIYGQKDIEPLSRGAVAIPCEKGNFISWRFLSTDPESISFDLMRDGQLIASNITKTTCVTDTLGTSTSQYTLITRKLGTKYASKPLKVWDKPYISIPLDKPVDGVAPNGKAYTYTPNDCSVADINGDGEYELLVKWDPSDSHDNSQDGHTGRVYLDCYKLHYGNTEQYTGKPLWRIDLGPNIRAGAHYTQFLFYDLNGDGKAELICKTAPGSKDGKGKYVSRAATDKEIRNTNDKISYAMANGRILHGPEFLTVFSGIDGHAIHTVYYNPNRAFGLGGEPEYDGRGWGDRSPLQGNRGDRFLACVAYLDGPENIPSAVFFRGYYTKAYAWAVQFDGKHIIDKWFHKSETPGEGIYGQGAHGIAVGDVDGDGYDEIMFGSAALDHDGSLLYTTKLGHGDAVHLCDIDPDRTGLEYYMPHEVKPFGTSLRDARTGDMLVRREGERDTGRGLAADIDSLHRGCEIWSSAAKTIYDCKGNEIATPKNSIPVNFRIYWDGDLYEELLGNSVNKGKAGENPIPYYQYYVAKWTGHNVERIKINGKDFSEWGYSTSCNGTKATPCLQADLFGDWREELILYDGSDNAHLNVFSTNLPTQYRIVTPMHDHIYRMCVAWQNVAYNQPPHLGYYLPDRYKKKEPITTSTDTLSSKSEVKDSKNDNKGNDTENHK